VHADALSLPFASGAFDAVWSQHAQMNIADKKRLYSEARRVLKDGGRLAIWDVIAGPRQPIHFPVPWADTPDISFLAQSDELREILEDTRFSTRIWNDLTSQTIETLRAQMGGPLGPATLQGTCRTSRRRRRTSSSTSKNNDYACSKPSSQASNLLQPGVPISLSSAGDTCSERSRRHPGSGPAPGRNSSTVGGPISGDRFWDRSGSSQRYSGGPNERIGTEPNGLLISKAGSDSTTMREALTHEE
jgi:hypothetical protein